MTKSAKMIRLATCCVAGVFILCIQGCGGKSDKVYKEGVASFESGDYAQASSLFQQAIEDNPDKAEHYIGYGMSLIGLAEYENAREQFLFVVRDTDNKIVRENNKKAYRGIALTYYESGVYDQAKAYFGLALDTKELLDLDSDLLSYLANCEMFLGNYESASKTWTKLIDSAKGASDEEMSSYYMGRAKSKTMMDNDLAAVEDYRMAIDCNKFCYPAHIGLYLALVNTHDVNAADQVLVDALELENKKEDDRYYKGILHYYKGEYDKAELLLSEAIDLEHYEAYYYLGRVYMARAKFEEALEYFTSFLEECPSGINAEYCNELGGCYMEMKEYELAREWFAKGVEIAAGNVRQQILYNEIIAYERLGNYKEAKTKASEYLEEYTDEAMQKEYEFIKTRSREEVE